MEHYDVKPDIITFAKSLTNGLNPLSGVWAKEEMIAYDSVPGVSIYELHRLAKVVKMELPQIKTPTLILHSRQDDTASMKNAEYIESYSGAAYMRKIILTDCYHMITIDNQKDLVAAEIVDFFKGKATL